MLHWLNITWYFNPKNFKIAQNTWPHIDSASYSGIYFCEDTRSAFYTTSDFLWLNAMYYLHTLWMLQSVDMEYIAFYWITIIQMCLYWKFMIVAVMNVRLGAVMGMVEKMRLVGKMRGDDNWCWGAGGGEYECTWWCWFTWCRCGVGSFMEFQPAGQWLRIHHSAKRPIRHARRGHEVDQADDCPSERTWSSMVSFVLITQRPL